MRKSQVSFGLLLLVVVLLLGYTLINMEYALSEGEIQVALPNGALTDAQDTAIRLLADVSKLLISWNMAIIGGVGLFLKFQIESKIRLRVIDLSLIALTLMAAISSLYFAQIGFDVMVRNLALQQFPLENDRLFTAFKWQFILEIAALVSLGLQVYQYCWRKYLETPRG